MLLISYSVNPFIPFQQSLMLVGKARLGWKGLPGTKLKFIRNIRKLFTDMIYEFLL
jgi:hypothetical protein